jgi:O-antigen ligase
MNLIRSTTNLVRIPSAAGGDQKTATQITGGVSLAVGKHTMAFVGVYLFTFLLYLRPNELFPEIFGTLPIIKFIAIGTVVAYIASKMSSGEPLTIWPTEVKMVMVLVGLSFALMPFSPAPGESWEFFNDTFSKVVIVFILMVNLLDSHKRLFSLFKLLLIGGVWIAYGAIQVYIEGKYMLRHRSGISRIAGVGGGMFGNPNDLANALVMLIPLAIALGLCRKGFMRWVYFGVAGFLSIAVLITFSRGAFLGLVALSAFLMFKLFRGKRIKMVFIASMAVVFLMVAAPGGFGNRISTIFDQDKDKTGSASERQELLKRGLLIAAARPLGVGLANYHMFSLREQKAHNGYIEISGELGLLGLFAYLVINFKPLSRLRKLERELEASTDGRSSNTYYLCISVQAVLVAYVVCSMFASIQYFWYLYYPVAYAIGLCRVYEREGYRPTVNLSIVAAPQKNQGVPGGVLWKTDHPVGALWKSKDKSRRATVGNNAPA